MPHESSVPSVAVEFRYQEKAGGTDQVITHIVPFDWDAETLTGSVSDQSGLETGRVHSRR